MPPKAKFKKDEIINASIEIVREDGFKALTARNLANKLASSPRPIFTTFSSMEEVIEETRTGIYKLYKKYVQEGLESDLPFKGTGVAYIKFAIEEPKLFQVLFMSETNLSLDASNVLQTIDEDYENEINLIQSEYSFTAEEAHDLYLHMWVFTHGIATLCATRVCAFTPEQISSLLSDSFKGKVSNIKGK